MVVGAYQEDSDRDLVSPIGLVDSGAAYVFVRNAYGVWQQQAMLKASNAESGDAFGWSVDISGDTIVVGAFGEDANGTSPSNNDAEDSGAAYIFVRNGNQWYQTSYLKGSAPDAEDNFGGSVAISGNTLVVSAYAEDSNGVSPANNELINSGAAYVFAKIDGIWSEQAYLKASNTNAGDQFGHSISLDTNLLAVGARYKNVRSNPAGIPAS